jgi:hypothetical protein
MPEAQDHVGNSTEKPGFSVAYKSGGIIFFLSSNGCTATAFINLLQRE